MKRVVKKIVFVMPSPWLLAFYLRCDVIKVTSVQTWLVYFFLRVQPLSTNLGSAHSEQYKS